MTTGWRWSAEAARLSDCATRLAHVDVSLLPPPARRSRVAGRDRGGGEGDENDAAVGPGLPWHLRLSRRSASGKLPPRSGPCPELAFPQGLRHSQICWPSRSSSPCGEDDLAEGRARRGSPGIEHLTDERLKICQPQGPSLTDRVGLAPAADARRAARPGALVRRPPSSLGLRPVGPPPQGGRGIARRYCVIR